MQWSKSQKDLLFPLQEHKAALNKAQGTLGNLEMEPNVIEAFQSIIIYLPSLICIDVAIHVKSFNQSACIISESE